MGLGPASEKKGLFSVDEEPYPGGSDLVRSNSSSD